MYRIHIYTNIPESYWNNTSKPWAYGTTVFTVYELQATFSFNKLGLLFTKSHKILSLLPVLCVSFTIPQRKLGVNDNLVKFCLGFLAIRLTKLFTNICTNRKKNCAKCVWEGAVWRKQTRNIQSRFPVLWFKFVKLHEFFKIYRHIYFMLLWTIICTSVLKINPR